MTDAYLSPEALLRQAEQVCGAQARQRTRRAFQSLPQFEREAFHRHIARGLDIFQAARALERVRVLRVLAERFVLVGWDAVGHLADEAVLAVLDLVASWAPLAPPAWLGSDS